MNEKSEKKIDYILLAILFCMSMLSLLAIYSALPWINSNYSGSTILLKQVIWHILGYGTLFVLFKMDRDKLENLVYIFYYILMFLLLLLIIQQKFEFSFLKKIIVSINGSYCWYTIPKIGTFQPSEFMKIVLIILVPLIIERHHVNYPINNLQTDVILVFDILKLVIPPCILIYIQPDSGLTLIILFSLVAMLFVSGIKREWIVIGVSVVIIIVAIVGIMYLVDPDFVIKYIIGGTYKINRIYGWLYPEKYISTYGHQLYTSLLAIGSAGVNGYGIQNVPLYIAESQTDFIFAIIASSFGLIGALIAWGLSLALDMRLLYIGMRTRKGKNKYIIAGLVGILAFQQIENMGMIIGLLPITGITLPFISAGGSSLLSYMIIFALVFQMFNDFEKKENNL
ncbi:MAG: FtsW/RodA/SpoVE family cell cycle protein [Erysipelotrichaceae bacterium]|nr:FtsW/RodA/SpoVE family cell cycle protein [Erysipelotrichaceae bacterium]MBR3693373.1 FtsW/RodA/SpoVE family cell cycle protein [Erysipelotrichales bacterium]